MTIYNYKVSLTPKQTFEMIKNKINAELVYEEEFDLGQGKFTATIIYEKYYMRTDSRAALIVLINNLNDLTFVRAVSTGSSQGIFDIDWGAANSFANSVGKVLENYIID